MIPEFYKVGQTYKIIGYKEPLTLVEIDDKIAKFTWMGGLKYHIHHGGKRPMFMYKNINSV